MQTSIKLQDPFKYSVIPLIILLSVIFLITFCLIYLKIRKKSKEVTVKEIPEKNIKNIPVIKGKYINLLDSIEYKYKNNEITLRTAYQQISEAIRMFVFEITDITTQNYSLSEIKKLKLPHLYELIEEYYEPEFASKSIVGDFEVSINKARGVIKQWNYHIH